MINLLRHCATKIFLSDYNTAEKCKIKSYIKTTTKKTAVISCKSFGSLIESEFENRGRSGRIKDKIETEK